MYNPQLDTFIQVAESGSFSKAAQALYITPTAVIKQMNLLEGRLGITLFHRTHRGLTLTKAGESLLADAKHIVRYSQESIARAHAADRVEKRVVRVGVSLMTPTSYLSRLWPRMRKRCPGTSMQVVTFENTEAARGYLRTLGGEMDIVVGVFDDAFLREYGCAGLEISREPVHCAVPVESDLAEKDVITFDDLEGGRLMLIQRGWNLEMDKLREEMRTKHPSIDIVDFPQYRAEVFNRCASEGLAVASLAVWSDVHPMLKTVPTDWGYAVSYGVMHAPEPSEHVQEFLDALKEELAKEHKANV